jgi:ATP-binding cassette subfamily B protein
MRSAGALLWRAARTQMILYALLTLAAGTVPVLAAWLTRLIIDDLAADAVPARLLRLTGALVLAGVVGAALPHTAHYLRSELDRRCGLLSQDQLLRAVDGFVGLGRFEDPRFLDRLRLAQQNGQLTCGDLVDGGLGVLRGSLTVVGFAATLVVLSPVLAAVVLLGGVPTVVAEVVLSRRRARTYWTIGPAQRRELFYAQLLTTVAAAKEMRLFGAGRYLRRRVLADRRTANAAIRAVDRGAALVQTALALLTSLIAGAGLLWATAAARHGQLSVGDVVIFVAAAAGVQGALAAMATDVARAHYALQMFGHFEDVTKAGPDLPAPVPPRPVPPLRKGVELRDVWFRYADDHPWVLRGVDLFIPYGTAVALVGRNGSGKSTLVKLLCRFYDPTRGAILWDGVDLRELDPVGLRRRIGAVFQDYVEYDLTVAENISLSDTEARDDRSRIRSAAEQSGVHQAVDRLPLGYDTLLSRTFAPDSDSDTDAGDGETGVMLSGGQWQRLALARSLFRTGRDLTILDEPSAGLDAEAEDEVHRTLRSHLVATTSLLISHRLNAVRQADLVAVLDQGQIIERGRHSELLAAGGEYARLFTLQATGYQTGATTPSTTVR